VKAIYVLADQIGDFPSVDEVEEGLMGERGTCEGKGCLGLWEREACSLESPDAVGASEVRDAGGGGDAGSCENNDALGVVDLVVIGRGAGRW